MAAKNVLGGELQCCCTSPKTGFYRDGFCNTGPQDTGVCRVHARDSAVREGRRKNAVSMEAVRPTGALRRQEGWGRTRATEF